jgi:hypothetical protein
MFDAPGEPGPRERAIKHIHESQPSAFRRAARVLRHAWAPPASRGVRGKLAAYERFVLFVGYPGSGHTLAGSILNAHPQALVANELDALFYLHNGLRRDRIVNAIARHERKFDRHARQNPKGYSYKFPNDSLAHKPRFACLATKRAIPPRGGWRNIPGWPTRSDGNSGPSCGWCTSFAIPSTLPRRLPNAATR